MTIGGGHALQAGLASSRITTARLTAGGCARKARTIRVEPALAIPQNLDEMLNRLKDSLCDIASGPGRGSGAIAI
jgi:hypothetical protein